MWGTFLLGADDQVEMPTDAQGSLERWVTDVPSECGIEGIERMCLVRDDIDSWVQTLASELTST